MAYGDGADMFYSYSIRLRQRALLLQGRNMTQKVERSSRIDTRLMKAFKNTRHRWTFCVLMWLFEMICRRSFFVHGPERAY